MTAIEKIMDEGALQFVVRKDMTLEAQVVKTPIHWIATGFHQGLNEAVKIALHDAIQFISKTNGLTRPSISFCCLQPLLSNVVPGFYPCIFLSKKRTARKKAMAAEARSSAR